MRDKIVKMVDELAEANEKYLDALIETGGDIYAIREMAYNIAAEDGDKSVTMDDLVKACLNIQFPCYVSFNMAKDRFNANKEI